MKDRRLLMPPEEDRDDKLSSLVSEVESWEIPQKHKSQVFGMLKASWTYGRENAFLWADRFQKIRQSAAEKQVYKREFTCLEHEDDFWAAIDDYRRCKRAKELKSSESRMYDLQQTEKIILNSIWKFLQKTKEV